MGFLEGILAYVLVIGVILYVLYRVIRMAVRDGIVDAHKRVGAPAPLLDEDRN
ncbi:hypothetical protein [Demequina sp. NBRC 110054]|uniref:hypothetical protein n=1 Tax=Demequina sp. NBRC 110054 TaxID=1570343 RepID=UPI00190E6C7A|nr:hypothetical protein [Demequina sp. NBRC 110054]